MAADADRLSLGSPSDNQKSVQSGGGVRNHGHVSMAQVLYHSKLWGETGANRQICTNCSNILKELAL